MFHFSQLPSGNIISNCIFQSNDLFSRWTIFVRILLYTHIFLLEKQPQAHLQHTTSNYNISILQFDQN